jgi:mannose-6-phosphate isomerase-like protein (cupin superfamily)
MAVLRLNAVGNSLEPQPSIEEGRPRGQAESNLRPTTFLQLRRCVHGLAKPRATSGRQPADVARHLARRFRHPPPRTPRTVAVVNDYDVRVVKVQGEFTRHSHPETDEFFLVLSGHLSIRMDDGRVTLRPGDTFVAPRGRAHQPYAETETTLLVSGGGQSILLFCGRTATTTVSVHVRPQSDMSGDHPLDAFGDGDDNVRGLELRARFVRRDARHAPSPKRARVGVRRRNITWAPNDAPAKLEARSQ